MLNLVDNLFINGDTVVWRDMDLHGLSDLESINTLIQYIVDVKENLAQPWEMT